LNTYKAIIQYKGTNFKGFQKQNSGVLTIQNTVEDVLKRISSDPGLKTIGSSRTDAGVHANNQVIKISMNSQIPCKGLMRAMNDLLPPTIKVKELELSTEDFHPIRDAVDKEYRYRFSLNQSLDPVLNEFCTNFYGDIKIDLMKAVCSSFEGTHDFVNYQTVGTDVDSTIRTVSKCEIGQIDMTSLLDMKSVNIYELRIIGTGFLKQMVRLITGAIIEAGKGKIDQSDIKKSLLGPILSNRLGPVAPAEGLVLFMVNYPIK
jgi:tRNA pseudouridine38-40 synthase